MKSFKNRKWDKWDRGIILSIVTLISVIGFGIIPIYMPSMATVSCVAIVISVFVMITYNIVVFCTN